MKTKFVSNGQQTGIQLGEIKWNIRRTIQQRKNSFNVRRQYSLSNKVARQRTHQQVVDNNNCENDKRLNSYPNMSQEDDQEQLLLNLKKSMGKYGHINSSSKNVSIEEVEDVRKRSMNSKMKKIKQAQHERKSSRANMKKE